jgi:hypothetical protein
MECRQLCQLDAPAVKKRAGRDENSIGPLATKGFEGNIDLSTGVGVERLDVQPHDASSRVHVSQLRLHHRSVGRIDEHGNTGHAGDEVTQKF